MATSKVPTKTCCELGRECQDMFKAFMAQPGGTKISVAEQQARFNIWAANIGVFAEADASLDRRLQEDDDVRAMVVQLLQLICRNLGRVNGVHDRLNEESDQVASMGKRSNSLSSRSLRLFGRSKRKEPTIPEPSQEVVEEKVTVVVKETIDRLQRLSSAIRQVSIQNRYLKGASLIERNDHRKNESFDFRKFAICMVKREYGGATDALREQLGISLSIRRNAFLWIIRHKEKIAQERKETSRSPIQVPVIDQKAPLESQDQLGSLQGRSRSTPSIARAKSVMSAVLSRTTVPVLPKGGLKPDYLQKISSPSQPSIGGASRSFLMVNDDQLPYPRVPIIVKGFNECSCPYCFETLQKDTVHDISKWRRHVIKDLEPYVCVFAECKGSLEFFEKFDDWLSHCKRLHCSEWLCDARVHEPQIFKTKDGFQNHMRSAHGGTFNESQLPLITELGVREGPRPFTECPLCNCVPEDIEEKRKKIGDNALDLLPEHIAFHLKALAFISLPWQDVGSEEETYLHKHADSFSHDVSLGKGEDGRTASTVKDPYMLEVNVRPPEQFPERPTDEEIKNPEADTRLSWWVFQEYSRANKTDLFVKKNPYLQQEDPIIQSIARSQSRQSSENSALGSIQDIRQRKETDKFQRFLEWLSPGHSSNNSVSLEESWSKHAPGTGEWLIRNEKFQSWKQKPNSLLSLYGKVGSGKTILSSLVKGHLFHSYMSDPAVAVAYFSFSIADSGASETEQMLCSLIRQLFSARLQNDGAFRRIQDDLGRYMERGLSPDLSVLESALSSQIRAFSAVYLVIDNLNNPSRHKSEGLVFDTLFRLREMRFDGLHLFCSSRTNPLNKEFRKELVVIPDWEFSLNIQDYRHEISKDIALITDRELESAHHYMDWPETLKHEVKETLISKADGMHLYASLQLEELRHCSTQSMALEAIQEAPRGLDAIYEEILLNISLDYHEEALGLLELLSFPARPLRLTEIGEMVILDPYSTPPWHDDEHPFDLEQICQILGDTIIFTPENQGCTEVRLVHATLGEYLASKRCKTGPASRFAIDKTESHLSMARSCLTYHCYLSETELATKDSIQQHAAWEYSALYWATHLEQVPPTIWSPFIIEKVEKVLSPYSQGLLNMVRMKDPDTYNRPNWKKTATDLRPPIYYAMSMHAHHLVELLLETGVDVNQSFEDGKFHSLLEGAVEKKSTRFVAMLLQHGADVNAQAGHYGNALQAAARNGHEEITKILIERGADINAQGGYYGNALQAATYSGYLEIMKLLIERGADINAQGGYYGNALQAATYSGYLEIMKLLIERGADINAQGGYYGNALQAAALGKEVEIMKLLIEKGADINAQEGAYGNALYAAAYGGDVEITKLLIERGADFNAQGGKYGNALQAAAFRGKEKLVRLLLEKGAKVNAPGGSFGNALQAAAYVGSEEIVQLLLEKGADVNAQGGEYGNALQAAAWRGSGGIVQLLLEKGANVNLRGGCYSSALEAAVVHDELKMARFLRDHGAVAKGNVSEIIQRKGEYRLLDKDEARRLQIFYEDPEGYLAAS